MSCEISRSLEKKFSMILKVETMLSVVFYVRKSILFYGRIQNFRRIILSIIYFLIQFFHYCFSTTIKKWLDFHESWLNFSGRIFSTTLLFPISKVKFSVAEIVKIFSKKKVFGITIFEDYLLIFETWNSRVVVNVFCETNKSWLMKTQLFFKN